MSSNVVRLKSYRTMFADGKSSVTANAHKGRVIVFICVGDEDLKLSANAEMVNVEDIIITAAKTLRRLRKMYGKPDTHEEARFRVDKAINIACEEYKKANA